MSQDQRITQGAPLTQQQAGRGEEREGGFPSTETRLGMSWEYRVMRYEEGGETLYKIVEAYLDGERPVGWCNATVDAWSYPEWLSGTIDLMRGAFAKPTLTEADFVEEKP